MPQKRQIVCVSACIRNKDQALVVKRAANDTYHPGYWEFPGGCVEWGESPLEAVKREVLEEVHLHVAEATLYGVFTDTDEDGRHIIEFAYDCTVTNLEHLTLCDEHDAYQWIKATNVSRLQPLSHHVQELILAGFRAPVVANQLA